MEPGGPQFERANARFEQFQRDYAKKLNSSDRLKTKLGTRRRNDKWPRYLRVLDAFDEGVTYEEIGKELKGLAKAGLEIEGMSHGFTVKGRFYDPLVAAVLGWMKEQLQ